VYINNNKNASSYLECKFFGANSDLGLGIYTVLDFGECMAALIAVNSGTVIFYDV